MKDNRFDWWFWLDPANYFEVKYCQVWHARLMKWIGPFTFRACAERERADRLVSDVSLRPVHGGNRKETQ